MTFRADESARTGFETARRVLASTSLEPGKRKLAEQALADLVDDLGPVVEAYPTWHPLVPQFDATQPVTEPSIRCGYKGLDHTVCFVNGFVTCPYGDGEEVLNSVEKLKYDYVVVSAMRLDVELYSAGTSAIVVRCDWDYSLDADHMIPKRVAVPLMMEEELRNWRNAEVGESWETMRPYILGVPHGSRSSLFVSQDSALAMKRALLAMTESGMFGPTTQR